MIVIDVIRVTKCENSKMDLSKVKEVLEKRLKAPKLSITSVGWYDKEKEEVKLVLSKPLPLYRMCRIISDLNSVEHIPTQKFIWEANKEGPIRRGAMDITVS